MGSILISCHVSESMHSSIMCSVFKFWLFVCNHVLFPSVVGYSLSSFVVLSSRCHFSIMDSVMFVLVDGLSCCDLWVCINGACYNTLVVQSPSFHFSICYRHVFWCHVSACYRKVFWLYLWFHLSKCVMVVFLDYYHNVPWMYLSIVYHNVFWFYLEKSENNKSFQNMLR